jgi:D-amino-acid dehydrogenase
VTAEPALAAVRDKIAGGLRLPDDETGDCHMFTQKLAALCAGLGVRFQFGTTIDGLIADATAVTGVSTSDGILAADAYIVALGSYSPLILRRIGISLPVYPVKGYSITLPIANPTAAPISTVMDETYKVAITRLGDSIRAGGTAEVSGYDLALDRRRRAPLARSVSDLFPRAGNLAEATFWTGLRPMTPDGTPVIGPTHYRNLHLNTGHGTLGWTMACGSGSLIADFLSGRDPAIKSDDFAIARYQRER